MASALLMSIWKPVDLACEHVEKLRSLTEFTPLPRHWGVKEPCSLECSFDRLPESCDREWSES